VEIKQFKFEKPCRAVCGHCLQTFLAEYPKEREICLKCGEGLIYIYGDVVAFNNEGEVINESNI